MTQPELDFSVPARETLVDKMLAEFVRHPGEWLDVQRLAEVGGIGGWRTRVSDVRHRGVRIEQRLIKWPDGRNRSQYCYRPSGAQRSGA